MTEFEYAQYALIGARVSLRHEKELLEKCTSAKYMQEHQQRVIKAEKDEAECLNKCREIYFATPP